MKIDRRRVVEFLLLLTCSAAGAQTPTASPAPAPAKPAPIVLHYDRAALASVARDLAGRAGRSIVLDSTAKPNTPVTVEGEAATLDEALTRVTGPLGLIWRKIYLPGREGDGTGEQVRAAARALEAMEGSGVIVEDPSLGKATLFMRSVPSAADFETKVRATWPQMHPYYLISDPRAAARPDAARKEPAAARKPGAPTPEEFAALERQRMEMFLRLTPEQRAAATAQAMDVFLQADPAVMQEMMQTGMQAWLQSMQRMTPEQRQQLFQRSMQMMQSIPPQDWQDIFGVFRPQ
jgi:hypothetical protein